jgi:hypothetical protein
MALNRQRLSFAPPPIAIRALPASRDNAVPSSAVSLLLQQASMDILLSQQRQVPEAECNVLVPPTPSALHAHRACSVQKCLVSPLTGVKDCTMLTRALSSSISRTSASDGLDVGDSAADEAVDVLVGGGMDEAAVSEVIREISQLVTPRHGIIDQIATVEVRLRRPLHLHLPYAQLVCCKWKYCRLNAACYGT